MEKARAEKILTHARINAAFRAANLPHGTLMLILRDRQGNAIGETAVEVHGFPVIMAAVPHALN